MRESWTRVNTAFLSHWPNSSADSPVEYGILAVTDKSTSVSCPQLSLSTMTQHGYEDFRDNKHDTETLHIAR